MIEIGLLRRRGQLFSEMFSLFLIGLPFAKKKTPDAPATTPAHVTSAEMTKPYGVAIGIGSNETLAVALI